MAHRVYVVELSPDVHHEKRFAEENDYPDHTVMCLYVGVTGHDPETRFANHKSGYKASKYVKRYGLRLRPDLYGSIPEMPYEEAEAEERRLARSLRRQGFAVWQK